MKSTAEHKRLTGTQEELWKTWGPYLSERQWGTVREDYSENSDAWKYFPHDHARSRAYRWGEDGLAGFSDTKSYLCMGLALWNGKDPIIKERLFGLTNPEGNHGEDVKELYYYLDATPTHSYCKMLYKYPQRAFPYDQIVAENKKRGKQDAEFEIWDSDAFADDRYYDVQIEYIKNTPEDIIMRVTATNRGPHTETLHILPQLWCRNSWAPGKTNRPSMKLGANKAVLIEHEKCGEWHLHSDGDADMLFCENETNLNRHDGAKIKGRYFKDGINNYLVDGDKSAVNPSQCGTKVAAHNVLEIPAGESRQVQVRFCRQLMASPFKDADTIVSQRVSETDEFYQAVQHGTTCPESLAVQRQAFAGMIWSKQFYYYDVKEWLEGDPSHPQPPANRAHGRNYEWRHLNNADIISMPDKWEYPWYAAWDLAFHTLPIALIDASFAKNQLELMLRVWYQHPNGQIPAYEWNFSDVNPPVHAWACLRVFQIDRKQNGHSGDYDFLERVFHKMLVNFTWWVNRKDSEGRNLFQGGFLGLDNIGVFDRNTELPDGFQFHQSDGTAWMSMYALNMMRIALILSEHNPNYQNIATKFFEHFLYIAEAMTNMAEEGLGLWDDDDKFYYDLLSLPDGTHKPLKLRSIVGLIPLFAVETLEPCYMEKVPEFAERMHWFLENKPRLAELVSRWEEPGRGHRHLLSLLRGHRMKRLLSRMLDETEFLSDYGIRGLSKVYQENPYIFSISYRGRHREIPVQYQPGESDSDMFGGNSNWRGPIWFPINFLIIESLQQFHHYYGDDFKVECPTGSGQFLTIKEIADELARRLVKIFLPDDNDQRPVYHGIPQLRDDPNFKNHILFYEYFHGDNGRGIGASHQTGWTGLVAKLIHTLREDID